MYINPNIAQNTTGIKIQKYESLNLFPVIGRLENTLKIIFSEC
jgi:hypothetical protein